VLVESGECGLLKSLGGGAPRDGVNLLLAWRRAANERGVLLRIGDTAKTYAALANWP